MLQDGRLTLDADRCWMDAGAFGRTLKRASRAVEDKDGEGCLGPSGKSPGALSRAVPGRRVRAAGDPSRPRGRSRPGGESRPGGACPVTPDQRGSGGAPWAAVAHADGDQHRPERERGQHARLEHGLQGHRLSIGTGSRTGLPARIFSVQIPLPLPDLRNHRNRKFRGLHGIHRKPLISVTPKGGIQFLRPCCMGPATSHYR